MRRCVLVLLVVLAASVAQAQTSVPQNTAFTVTADHADNATPATGFRCYVDGVKVGTDLPASARVNGVVSCAMPGQAVLGPHTVSLSAFNAVGETMSTPLAFTVVTPPVAPTAPTNLKITVTVQIASTGVTVLGVEAGTAP